MFCQLQLSNHVFTYIYKRLTRGVLLKNHHSPRVQHIITTEDLNFDVAVCFIAAAAQRYIVQDTDHINQQIAELFRTKRRE